MPVLVKKDSVYFQIQEIVCHLFNPFAAALASLSPAERYEAEFMGASEFLNRRVNEELQRAFEAGIPSSEVYPSAKIYHIGTRSERPTSEGFRSAVSQGTSSVPSHPTSSPVSFGPSTPVQRQVQHLQDC